MTPQDKGKSRRLFFNALLAVLLTSAGAPGSSSAQQSYPTPGGASGSQTGDGSAPFAALAADPTADLFTGSATVGLPITVPPGRGDLTPSLGLAYNSASSSSPGGAWGRGWGLPTASIKRSTRFGVPRYDSSDTFVLELGGAAIELTPEQGQLYRPASNESALRAGWDQAANRWKVFDPTGLVHWFAAGTGPDTNEPDETFSWVIEKTENLFGNTIEYQWQAFGSGELLPTAVRYGGNQQIANFIEVAFDYLPRVYPDQPRADYGAGFRREFSQLLDSIVTRVNGRQIRRYSLTHAVDAVTGAALLQTVNLDGYGLQAQDDVSMPPAVFLYAPTLQTGWPLGSLEQRADYAISFNGPNRIRDPRGEPKLELLDMTGDGLVDQLETGGAEVTLRRGNGRGFDLAVDWPSPVLNNIRDIDQTSNIQHNIFDLDGDGLPDYVEADEANLCSGPGLPTAWCLHRNTGNSFSLVPQTWPAPSFDIRQADANGDRVHVEIVDLNSDGLPDWVASWPWSAANPWWTVHWNTGSGFSAVPSQFAAPRAWIMQRHSPGDEGYLVSGLMDINGDGLPDFVDAAPSTWPNATGNYSPQEMSEQHWLVYFNNGSGFESQPHSWGPGGNGGPGGNEPLLANYISHDHSLSNSVHSSSTASQELVDITGDGLPDLVAPITGSGQAHLEVLLCINGEAACQVDPFNVVHPPVCCLNNYLFVNNGSGFSDPQPLAWWNDSGRLRLVSTPPAVPYPSPQLNHDLLDFDGDGLVDLVELHRQPDGSNLWQVHLNPASPGAGWSATPDHLRTRPGAMVAMENGVGGVTQLEYSPVSMQDDEACQYDAQGNRQSGKCLPFPWWTLTRSTLLDVIDTDNDPVVNDWAYQGASWDPAEREFRGFSEAVAVNPAGIAKFTWFHQDPVRRGKSYGSARLGNPPCLPGSNCNPWDYQLDRNDTTWPNPEDVLSGTAPLAPVSQTRTAWRWDGSCGQPACPLDELALTTSWQYDQWGNETRRASSSPSIPAAVSTAEYAEFPGPNPSTLDGRLIVTRPLRLQVFQDEIPGDGVDGVPLTETTWEYGPNFEVLSKSHCLEPDTTGCTRWSTTNYGYTSDGLLSRETSPTGSRRTLVYGGSEKLYPTSETVADGTRVYNVYDHGTGKLLQATASDGRTSRTEYDGLGRPLRSWSPGFTDPNNPESTVAYTEPVAECDQEGQCTGERGNVLAQAWRQPSVITFYDGLGREVATRTETDRIDSQPTAGLISGLKTYDTSGRVTAQALPFEESLGNSTALLSLDVSFADTDPDTHSLWSYDPVTGSLLATVLPGGETTYHERSVAGVRATVDANMMADNLAGNVTLDYLDALGQVTRTEACASLPDLDSGQSCSDQDLLARSDVVYDALGRITERWLWKLESQPFEPVLYETNWYDGQGQLVARSELDAGSGQQPGTWLYQRDDEGRVQSFVDPVNEGATLSARRGVVVTSYDKAGRVRKRKGGSGANKIKQTYRYTRAFRPGEGQVERVKSIRGDSKVSRRFTYNDLGLVASEYLYLRTGRARSRHTITYQYDQSGRMLSVDYPLADSAGRLATEQLVTSYDELGRPVGLSLGGQPLVTAVDYDAWGRINRLDYGNGLSDHQEYLPQSENGYLRCLRTSPSAFHQSGAATCGSSISDLRAVEITERDELGRVLERVDHLHQDELDESLRVGSAGPMTGDGGYDRLGRLVEITYQQSTAFSRTEHYAYDSLGNMVLSDGQVFGYDPARPHRLVNAGGIPLTWDANGRRTGKGYSSLSWDLEGHLASSTSEAGSQVSYALDEAGARVGRYEVATATWSHVYSTHGAGALFEIEDDQLVRYFRLAGRLVAADRIAAPSDLSLARYTQPGNQPDWPPVGTTVYYHADYLGSTRLVTDQAGDPLRYLRHDAWGETLAVYQVQPDGSVEAQLITGSGNRWGFTGQRDEPGQGLVDFGRRWYDPATRQFLSPDPEGQFANPRAYGPWDPLNGTDPDGGFFFPGLPLALNWALTSGIVNFAITATQTGDLGAGLQAGMMGAMTGALGATGIQGALLKPLFTAAALGNATAATALQATFALASVANSAARGDIAGVFLFVGGAAFGETSLSAKSAQLQQRSLAAAQEVGTTGAQSETVSVLIEEPNPNSPSKLGRKGMSGHTGVGVGDEYWDYGPQPGEGGNVFGSDGIPWWDSKASLDGDASLSEVIDFTNSSGKSVSIFSREVTPAQAGAVRSHWNKLYSDPGTYHFAGRQCTTAAAASLRNAGIGSFRALKPSSLANQLRAAGWAER